jgi:perosamine synthetase
MRKIVIAYPYVSEKMRKAAYNTLGTRFIGQGPKVDEFEKAFEKKFHVKNAVAVNSGTAALELAYDLVGIKEGDEVITPVLTCTATNLPLVRRKAKLVFADINITDLMASKRDIEFKITKKTKAIVTVDLNGLKSTRGAFSYQGKHIPLIVDAAQALGNFGGDFTTCSFQAIKHLTTGDGGMLICKNPKDAAKAKLLRWFGIDRAKKLKNNWQPYKNRAILFDIDYAGYKFQMNDIAASLGIEGLKEYDQILKHRKKIFNIYKKKLPMIDGDDNKCGFACMNIYSKRDEFAADLLKHGIETNVMQVRNDIYSIFAPYRQKLINMDYMENRYICLPLHNRLSIADAKFIAKTAARFLYG